MGNGYSMSEWHPAADQLSKHTVAYKPAPLFWTRRAPESGETFNEWKDRTQNDSYVCEIEEISWILLSVVVMELVADHMPRFVMQWGDA